MSINLDKHRDSLTNAWKDVLDDKTATDWVLFGYEGMSNDLKVVSKGDGGIEELTDDLNSGKIMYAFLRVEDPKTSLYKYVLINWQGEGAPTVRKGTCANHIRDVGSFFSGAHLTLHARTEEDIDPKLVVDKVANAGSAYSFKAPRSEMTGPTGPIGTTYVKVNPGKEINSKERDQFWLKEEQEEKNRVAAEKKRLEQERRKAEEEQRIRAEAEATRLTQEDNAKIQRLKSPQNENAVNSGLSASEALRRQRSKEAKELIGHSTSTARALFEQNSAQGQLSKRSFSSTPEKPVRSSVIAQRINSLNQQSNNLNTVPEAPPPKTSPIKTIDKIKLSLESPSQIQHEPILIPNVDLSPSETNPNLFSAFINNFNESPQLTEEPEINNINTEQYHVPVEYIEEAPIEPPKNFSQNNHHTEDIIRQNILENDMFDASLSSNDVEDDDSDNKFSTIKRSPHSRNNISDGSNGHGDLSRQNTVIENVHFIKDGQTNGSSTPEDVSPEALEDDGIYQDLDDDSGLTAKALYDYQAADESEISFDPGDHITHIDQIDEGWWQGLGPQGDFGLFPANYVELLPCKPRL